MMVLSAGRINAMGSHAQKKSLRREAHYLKCSLFLLSDMILIAVHEFINSSGRINKLHLPGIERM